MPTPPAVPQPLAVPHLAAAQPSEAATASALVSTHWTPAAADPGGHRAAALRRILLDGPRHGAAS